jgi:mannosyltransferase PIG-V
VTDGSPVAAATSAKASSRPAGGSLRAVRRTAGDPAVRTWLASRALVVVAAVLVAPLLATQGSELHPAPWPLDRLAGWDTWHFTRIAERGYLPPGLPCCDQAFFPGYPALIRVLMPVTGGSALAAGVAVSLLAGVAAAALLRRLALALVGDERVARTAVRYLAVAPFGVFLTAVYSEALFLALSLGAWLAAARQRWWLAGAVAAAASLVRVNGLFLAVALGVLYLGQLHAGGGRRPRADILALGLPVLATAGYFGYLTARTGSLTAWQDAQVLGWDRHGAWPWQGLAAGWHHVQEPASLHLVASRWADLLSVVAGVALVLVLARLRRWAQATYIGLSVTVLVCSTTLVSAPRYTLTWFPAYLLLAELAHRPGAGRVGRWLRGPLPAVCGVAMLGLTVVFATHRWVA